MSRQKVLILIYAITLTFVDVLLYVIDRNLLGMPKSLIPGSGFVLFFMYLIRKC